MPRRNRAARQTRDREIAAWWRTLQASHNGIGIRDVMTLASLYGRDYSYEEVMAVRSGMYAGQL